MEEEKSTQDLVKSFLSLQDERVEAYSLFEEGFQAYLKGAPHYNFELFKQLVAELTASFSSLSQAVTGVCRALRPHAPCLAHIVDSVQQCEQRKLEATTQLQLALKEQQDKSGEEGSSAVVELKAKVGNIRTEIFELLQDFRYEAEEYLT